MPTTNYIIVPDANATTVTYYEYKPVALGSMTLNQYVGTPTVVAVGSPAPADSAQMMPYVEPGGTAYWCSVDQRWYPSYDLSKFDDTALQKAMCVEADLAFTSDVAKINVDYSSSERETWPTQLQEAQTVIGGGTSEMLNSMLLPGEDVKDLAQKIVANSTAYKTALGSVLAARRSAKAKTATATVEDFTKTATVREITVYSYYNARS